MKAPIDTIVYGLGPIGRRIAGVAAAKQSLRLVGAVDVSPEIAGKPLAALVANAPGDVVVVSALDALGATPVAALHATGSHLARVRPQFEGLLQRGISVVSTCEELAFPVTAAAEAILADLDALAKAHGARLLGTGINPGFAMDLWPLIATAAHGKLQRLEVTRIVDAASRREPLQRKVGSGMTADEFRAGVAAKTLGHVGLPASAAMLARGLGRDLLSQQEWIEPVLAEGEVTTQYFRVPAGRVVGQRQELVAELSGGVVLVLHLEMYLDAPNPRDEVVVHGDWPSKVTVSGGFAGDSATAAIIANAVAPLLACPPGYHTMLDLPAISSAP
ncbi:MAG: NAD(P)H-dependent amine dehydrogenase family protein [Anaerolineae bacterium]